jgi:hypothetical protein
MAENKDKKKNFHSVVSGYIDYVPKDYNAFVSALKSDPALADRLYSDLVKLEAQGYVNSVPVPDDIRTIFTGTTTTTPTTTTETEVVAEEETPQQGVLARRMSPIPQALVQRVQPQTNQPQPTAEETQIAPIDQQAGQVQGGRPISGDVLANAPKQEFQWSGQAPTKPVVQPQTGMPQTRDEGMQQGGINPTDLAVSTIGSFETSLIGGIGSELKGISELGYSLDKKIVGALEGTPLEGQYAMLSKPEDSWIYQAGQGLQNFAEENLYRNPEYQGGVADIVAQGIGSVASIMATGGLNPAGGVVKLGTKAMTNPQLIAYGAKQLFSRPSISGALMMVGQETDEARKLHRYANSVPKDEYVFNRVALGESEEDASKAYDKLKSISEDEVASGMIPFALFSGATEAIPMERLFTRLGKASKDIVISAFKNGGIQGTEEAIQEMIQQTISNVGKGQVYNEAQRLSEGLVESAEGGGATGFVLGSILTALAGKRANIAKAVADGTMTKEEAIAELNDVNKAQTLVNDKLQALDNIVNSVANEDVKKLTGLPESKTFFDKNEASLTNPITTMPTQVETIMDKIDGGILISAESLHEAYQWTNNAVKETLANQTLTPAEKGATLNILNGMLTDIDRANTEGQRFVEQVEEVSVQDRVPAVREGVKPLPQGQAPKGTATPSISQAKAIREENKKKQAGTNVLPSSGQTIVTPAPATTEVATEAVTETPTGTTAEAEVKLAELPTKTIEAEVVSETPVAGAEANPALADVEVKSFKQGDGGTRGVFEGKDGQLYKSIEPQEMVMTDKGVVRQPIKDVVTDEHKILSELQDNPHVPKVGKIVNTTEGKAFEIEKLDEVDNFTKDEYRQIQKILNDLNDKGYHVGDRVTVMKRPKTGELVIVDFSSGYKGDRMSRDAEDYMQNISEKISKSDAIQIQQEDMAAHNRDMAKSLMKNESTTEYYLTRRPPSIGTHPTEGLKSIEETEFKGRKVWKLTYDNKLSADQIYKFELTPKVTIKEFLGQKISGVFGKNLFYVSDIDYDKGKVTLVSELNGKEISKDLSFREFQKNIDDGKYQIIKSEYPTTPSQPQQVQGQPEALADVESTAKALEGAFKEGGKVDEDGFNYRNQQKVMPIVETFTPKMNEEYQRVVFEEEQKTPEQFVSSAYHKAKADGTNPELVKAVEQLLTPTQDAVQKQTAGQVPVQSGTTSSPEVAEGEPEAEPESPAQQGKGEATAPEAKGEVAGKPTTATTTTQPTLTPVNATDVETITKIENATEKGRELALAKPVNKWVKRAFDSFQDLSSRAKKAGIYDGTTLKIGGKEYTVDTPAKFKAFLAQSQANFDAINEAVKGVESFSSVTDNIMGKFSNIENQAKQNESKTDKQVDNDITLQSGVNPKQILSGFGAVMKGLGFGDKAVSKITTAVEDWTAKAARKAMRSRYAFVGKTANIAQGFIRNIARTDKEITQRRKALGTVKSSPLVAMEFYNNAVGIVGNNPQALQRVHQVLDPEAYEGEVSAGTIPRVVEADLNPDEKQLYDILRSTLDYIHDWHYNNGFIKQETYDKYKGTYSPRFWEDTNMIDESPELAVMFQQMGKSLDRSYIKQRKDIDNIQSDIVEDPVYGTAIRMAQTLRNQALLDYASQVSTTKAVWNGTGNPPPGFVLLEGPKFGALNGKYVARDVAEDFKGYYMSDALMNEAYRLFRIYDNTGVRQFVKQSKTVFNPITVIGNALSGISFAFGAGVDPANLSANIPAARKSVQNKDADYKYLVQQGILGTDVFTGDIKTKSESVRKPTSPTQKSLKEKLFDTMDKVREFYGATDDVTKLAVFKALLEQGKTREQAAKIVYESTQNYNEVGRAYDFVSKMPIVGNPYIKFKADLARIVKNGLTKRPLTTSAYIGALYAFAAMASKLSDEEEEVRKAREARAFIPKVPMPDFMKKIGLGDVPLVWQTKYGELNAARLFSPMYVYDTGEEGFLGNIAEVTSYLPVQLRNAEEGAKDIPVELQFNDPLLGPLAQLFFYGKNFQGKEILNPSRTIYSEGIASSTDKLLNGANYLANAWVPFYDKAYGVVQAVKGEEDYYGRVRNWKQALVSMVVKVQDMSKPEVIKSITKDIDYKVSRINDIEKEKKTILNLNDNELGSVPNNLIKKVLENDKFSTEVKNKKIEEIKEDAFAQYANLVERQAKIYKSLMDKTLTRQKITAPTRR